MYSAWHYFSRLQVLPFEQSLCATSDWFTGALSLASEKQQCLGFICAQAVDEATWEMVLMYYVRVPVSASSVGR